MRADDREADVRLSGVDVWWWYHDGRIMRTAFWATAMMAAFLHWIPHYPPQIDLAQHAGQIRFLHDWTQPGFPYRDILELNLFTPYLPAYLLGALLTFVMSPVTAVKLLWSVGAFGTVYTSVRIRRRLGGSAEWDWLLLPGLFGVAFVWGLLTFQFAVPLGLLAIEYWIVYLERPTVRGGALFGLAALALFFSHALVTAWVLLVCGTMVISVMGVSLRSMLLRGLPLLTPLPVIALWLSATGGRDQAQGDTIWSSLNDRVFGFFPDLLGGPSPALAAGVGAAIFLTPFLAGQRLSNNPIHRVPLLITMAILLAGPFRMFGNAFMSGRFFALLGPTLVIAMSGRPLVTSGLSGLRHLTPLLAMFWVLFVGSRMVLFSSEQRSFRELVAGMESHQRVLSVVPTARSEALGSQAAYLHFPVWYQAEHGGLVEFSFAAFYPMLLRFSPAYSSAVPERFAARPTAELIAGEAARFDYILVRASGADSAMLMSIPGALTGNVADWRLYAPTRR